MKNIIFVCLVFVSSQLLAQNPWFDGQDPAVPGDPGRGVTDWNAHYQASVMGNGARVPDLVKGRMMSLRYSLGRPAYSRLYADLSILIASYGTKYAGWMNGFDPRAPANDGNRGLIMWDAHYGCSNTDMCYDTGSQLVFDRLSALAQVMPPRDFARLYADCSIIIVNYSRMK